MIPLLLLKIGLGAYIQNWVAWRTFVLDAVLKISAFTIAHIRIILPVAIILYMAWCVHAANAHSANIQRQFNNHLAEDAKKAEEARKLRTKLFLLAEAKAYLANVTYQNTQATLLANAKSKLSQEIRSHEDDRNHFNNRVNSYRDGLQIAVSRYASAENQLAAIQGSGTDSHPTLSGCADQKESIQYLTERVNVCEEAGAMCAADYNYCYGYVHGLISTYGESK